MRLASGFIIILFSLQGVCASTPLEVVRVASGQLDPFWQAPVSRTGASGNGRTLRKKVKIASFEAMTTQVTESQFRHFIAVNPDWQKGHVPEIFADDTYLNSNSELGAHRNSPVTNVSWFAAQAFCQYYGMRLPTVNEWEYMAAASETTKDANKNEKFLQRILDWYGEPRREALQPVRSIYKNMYGLWDLHGLTWEWVYDFNSVFVTGESREDTSFNKNLFCGAGALSGADKENYAAFMRFAFRSSLKGKSSAWNLSFRCVR